MYAYWVNQDTISPTSLLQIYVSYIPIFLISVVIFYIQLYFCLSLLLTSSSCLDTCTSTQHTQLATIFLLSSSLIHQQFTSYKQFPTSNWAVVPPIKHNHAFYSASNISTGTTLSVFPHIIKLYNSTKIGKMSPHRGGGRGMCVELCERLQLQWYHEMLSKRMRGCLEKLRPAGTG